MNIQSYIPRGPLKEFVDSITFISGQQMGTGIAFPRMHQVIIINLGTKFSSSDLYAPQTKTVSRETDSAIWINGKHDNPFLLGNAGITSMYAIGVKLGMLPYFADLPAIETNNLTVGAENWTSRDIFDLREQLLACPSITAGFLLIENHLLKTLRNRDFSNLKKTKWLSGAIYQHTVNELCQTLGMTRKRLRSEAQYYFGGSIKNIQGIIRLNQTLAAIARAETIATPGTTATPHNTPRATRGASLSSLHDYFDQAHFIHDFKARTGITPSQYRRLCRQFPFIAKTPNFLALPKETFLQFTSAPEE